MSGNPVRRRRIQPARVSNPCARGFNSVDSRPPWLRAAAPDPSARAVVPSRLTQHACPMALAGGRGSRLMQLTVWRAKPAVPFAGRLKVID